jgi:hypothetical protein
VPRESYDGGPLRFDAGDERWGDDVKTARDCVAKLYNLATKPIAHRATPRSSSTGCRASTPSRSEGRGGIARRRLLLVNAARLHLNGLDGLRWLGVEPARPLTETARTLMTELHAQIVRETPSDG